jgi:hypothetical protein
LGALAALTFVAIAVVSPPSNRAVTVAHRWIDASETAIRRNVDALNRSRAWWESYGQRPHGGL